MHRRFVTADWHFGHPAVRHWRPFGESDAHDGEVIRRYRETVNKGDTVYVLGDAAWNAKGLALVRDLPGRKVLIAGNHDTYPARRYLDAGFADVRGVVVLDGDILLTHIPVSEQQFSRFRLNIHGHLHANKIPDRRYVNVSLERTDYSPVVLDEIEATTRTEEGKG